MNRLKASLNTIVAGLSLWVVGTGIVSATVINISLNPNDWELDPIPTANGWQSSNQSRVSTVEGLQVTNNTANPGSPIGAYARTVGSYNAQNAITRYKWKAISAPSYANYWNGYDKWTFGAGMTTGWSWAGSLVIPQDTWIYAQAYVGADLSYYYNFSYAGYDSSGGFRSGSGVTSQAFFDSLASVHLKASVNDNRNPGAGFVISEMSLTTPDSGQVPEPTTALLLCSGLAGFAGSRFRRKRI